MRSKPSWRKWILMGTTALLMACFLFPFAADTISAAYNHNGDIDSANFRTEYPSLVGTKLDSCVLCHTGGSYVSGGKTTTLGNCQWCHYKTGYGLDMEPATLDATLNPYGLAYKTAGRTEAALHTIAGADSDLDLFSNAAEIAAMTYPGDPLDKPSNIKAPSLVLTRDMLEQMPQHSQFMLMNASKSDDFYVTYSGVALEHLIKSVMLPTASGTTVYSPDGFATFHPFNPSGNPNSYHVFGEYPPATYRYNGQADMAQNPVTGWADYTSPACAGMQDGDAIFNPDGLRLMLAVQRDGEYLTPGVLNLQNKLDGEGPFRIVPPQKTPGPPDQRSTAVQATDPATWIWPYKGSADHNAGFASRTVTMIKIEPLPAGTTDINTMEAGWPYVDENKIIVYGSMVTDLKPRLSDEIADLKDLVQAADAAGFKNKSSRTALANKIDALAHQIKANAYQGALQKLKNDVVQKTDGCPLTGQVDSNDWVTSPQLQKDIYSAAERVWILLVLSQ
jgi:hypothetical protein